MHVISSIVSPQVWAESENWEGVEEEFEGLHVIATCLGVDVKTM